ncbi:hypothetical protein HY439_01065 [Candidatus Microgenomates bacterium]|nr:hypothetical protein [Candidatus Microgenomates bacterium]
MNKEISHGMVPYRATAEVTDRKGPEFWNETLIKDVVLGTNESSCSLKANAMYKDPKEARKRFVDDMNA